MFGRMKAQPIIRVTPTTPIAEAVNCLLTATDKAQAVRWIEFPSGVLLFVVVPGDPESGAFYVWTGGTDSGSGSILRTNNTVGTARLTLICWYTNTTFSVWWNAPVC